MVDYITSISLRNKIHVDGRKRMNCNYGRGEFDTNNGVNIIPWHRTGVSVYLKREKLRKRGRGYKLVNIAVPYNRI